MREKYGEKCKNVVQILGGVSLRARDVVPLRRNNILCSGRRPGRKKACIDGENLLLPKRDWWENMAKMVKVTKTNENQ